MGNINDTLFFGWQAFSWLLTAAGIWKILEKCGQHSLWALMPGIRYYKLSQVAMRERDGINVLLFELPTYLLMACVTFLPMSEQNQFFIAIVMVVMGLIMIVYKMRVISGLTRVFGMSIFWVLFWTLTPWLASIIWEVVVKNTFVPSFSISSSMASTVFSSVSAVVIFNVVIFSPKTSLI